MTPSRTFAVSEFPLAEPIESISSKKIIDGATCFAFLKISLTPFSDSPTYLFNNSGPLTDIKFASDSVATAFASSVFRFQEDRIIRFLLAPLFPF